MLDVGNRFPLGADVQFPGCRNRDTRAEFLLLLLMGCPQTPDESRKELKPDPGPRKDRYRPIRADAEKTKKMVQGLKHLCCGKRLGAPL